MSEEKTINEKIIYCIGSASFEKELELGQDITLLVKGSVLKIEKRDNQDGTYDFLYKVKVITIENAEGIKE